MKLQSVQFLRAIAALLVVYVHSIDLQMRFAVSAQQHFFYLQNFGAVGVDIFFAISGFIICYVANDAAGARDGIHFLVKRFLRINPVYYIASLLYLFPLALHLWKSGKPFDFSWAKALKTLLILPFGDKSEWISPVLLVGWSLSFEWFFYLLFFILILFKARNKTRALLLLLPFLVIAGRLFYPLSDYRLIFMTNPLILEFLCGGLICWCYFHVHIGRRFALSMVVVSVAILLFEIFTGFGNISEIIVAVDGNLAMQRFLLTVIPSAFLVAGCVQLEKHSARSSVWDHPMTTLVGDASYSVYLIHPTIFVLCSTVYLRWGFFLNPDLAVLLQTVIALTAGVLFYKLAELPLLHLLKKVLLKRSG
jgi:exopolysaccharide production protein ExoZ